ncbi:unnamed protein product [Ceratitis capitata]|uniref:(Mediterranean fruit fly) hypothetical protein n=1 Tax=Ceratitis capitata TaxID=7213 RepID=A0A811UZE3_CERCA|nr:unnamed protein product [Ceratitis capitata]
MPPTQVTLHQDKQQTWVGYSNLPEIVTNYCDILLATVICCCCHHQQPKPNCTE